MSTILLSTPPPVGVQLPIAPQPYSLPLTYTLVHNTTELLAALAGSPLSGNIVCANNTYANATPFNNPSGYNVYAQNLGGAILTAGINGGGGERYQGLVFDISTTSCAANQSGYPKGSCIDMGYHTFTALDLVMHGHYAVNNGILSLAPLGAIMQRLQLDSFAGNGFRMDDNAGTAYPTDNNVMTTVTDIDVSGVMQDAGIGGAGTNGFGCMFGHSVTNPVDRIRALNCEITGVWTGNSCWHTTFQNMTIDPSGSNQNFGVAIYIEHHTEYCTFQDFNITNAITGENSEWDYGLGDPGGRHNVTKNGTFGALNPWGGNTWGVYNDRGTDSPTVIGCKFLYQKNAAIGSVAPIGTVDYASVPNDYSGILPGAVGVDNIP